MVKIIIGLYIAIIGIALLPLIDLVDGYLHPFDGEEKCESHFVKTYNDTRSWKKNEFIRSCMNVFQAMLQEYPEKFVVWDTQDIRLDCNKSTYYKKDEIHIFHQDENSMLVDLIQCKCKTINKGNRNLNTREFKLAASGKESYFIVGISQSDLCKLKILDCFEL